MPRERDWGTGEGLIDISDPAEVDAAFDRNEPRVGTAVIGLVLNSDALSTVAPRVERALSSEDPKVRQLGFVAVGDTARLFGELTPAIYGAMRAEGLGGVADTAIKDTLTFVPFRELPWWLRRTSVRLTVGNAVASTLRRVLRRG
jgi:hypothetical protein